MAWMRVLQPCLLIWPDLRSADKKGENAHAFFPEVQNEQNTVSNAAGFSGGTSHF